MIWLADWLALGRILVGVCFSQGRGSAESPAACVQRQSPAKEHRFFRVPLGGLLVRMCEAKNSRFACRWTAELHADRQAFGGETTRNRDRRQPQRIEGPRVA